MTSQSIFKKPKLPVKYNMIRTLGSIHGVEKMKVTMWSNLKFDENKNKKNKRRFGAENYRLL